MAGPSTPELAIAVANGGGLGALACQAAGLSQEMPAFDLTRKLAADALTRFKKLASE
jgi:NAD(P)H-dependent flavin oxidoreductase YrpB (nitropropane dioxygenase family)